MLRSFTVDRRLIVYLRNDIKALITPLSKLQSKSYSYTGPHRPVGAETDLPSLPKTDSMHPLLHACIAAPSGWLFRLYVELLLQQTCCLDLPLLTVSIWNKTVVCFTCCAVPHIPLEFLPSFHMRNGLPPGATVLSVSIYIPVPHTCR
jgi:hypothetical protein